MDRTDALNLVNQLRTEIDNAETRDGLLTQITDAFGSAYDDLNKVTTERDELVTNNEQLRSANMKLFMEIGKEPEKTPQPEEEEKTTKLEFKNLFNEKGELK